MSRTVVALIATPVIVAAYGGFIYAFSVFVWPRLPAWTLPVVFVLIAVFLIGSPIVALARLGRKTHREP